MEILVLDDDDVRHERFAIHLMNHMVTHVHTYDACVRMLKTKKFDAVFLDHDLNMYQYKSVGRNDGGFMEEKTGMDAVRFLTREQDPALKPELVVVHSWNAVAAEYMMKELVECNKFQVVQWLFQSDRIPSQLAHMLRELDEFLDAQKAHEASKK